MKIIENQGPFPLKMSIPGKFVPSLIKNPFSEGWYSYGMPPIYSIATSHIWREIKTFKTRECFYICRRMTQAALNN